METFFFLTLGLFGLLFFLYYWKFQLVFDSSSLSLYTPPNLHSDLPEIYESERRGFDLARSSRIIIATMVRDIEKEMDLIIRKTEALGEMFLDYRVLIVENDSKDQTRERLLEWSARNPRVSVLGCGVNAEKCHLQFEKTIGHSVDRKRIQKMVDLRNVYLDHIKTHSDLRSFDYVAMWDLDAIGTVYLDGVATTLDYFSKHPDVSCVCANGIYDWGVMRVFYDTYAYVEYGEKFHIDTKTVHDLRKGMWDAKFKHSDPPLEVRSCFSGFSIYRTAALLAPQTRYSMSGEDNLECEHTRLCDVLPGRKVVNPAMINFLVRNE